jgi:hypothetical protein
MTDTAQDAAPTPGTSDFREELIQNGAHAQDIDVEALKASMLAMQNRIKALEAERGVPSNPIAGAVSNLLAHVKARKAALPQFVDNGLHEFLEKLPEDITSDHAAQAEALVTDTLSQNSAVKHELAYWPLLVNDLKKAVLAGVTGLF